MKKTFRLLAFALMASLVAFTACEPDDPAEGTNPGDGSEIVDDENPGDPEIGLPSGVMFGFDGAVDWSPQMVWVGNESDDDDEAFLIAIGTKEVTTFEQAEQILNRMDFVGDGIPTDAIVIGFYGKEGVQTAEGSIFEEEGDLAVILYTGTTNIDGETFATGWISTNMRVNVIEFDMANRKFSANITATMKDIINEMTYGNMGSSEEKTFTISFNNCGILDWYAKDLKRITKLLNK